MRCVPFASKRCCEYKLAIILAVAPEAVSGGNCQKNVVHRLANELYQLYGKHKDVVNENTVFKEIIHEQDIKTLEIQLKKQLCVTQADERQRILHQVLTEKTGASIRSKNCANPRVVEGSTATKNGARLRRRGAWQHMAKRKADLII